MVKIICKECLNIYIGGENPEPVVLSCDEVFNTDFTTTTDATLTSAGWSSVGANFGLTSNGGQGLHFVDYTTDKPAGIEFPISNIKGKTIKFSIEWQIGTYTRRGGGDFRISTINNSGTGVKDQYTSGFNLCTFPFYASGTGGGQYSGMGTGGRWYTDTPGSSSVGINGDQDGTVYMGTYGNTHLGLTIGTGVWKAEGEYDLKNMVYTCSFSTIVNGETSTATFTRTFNNATSAEKAKMEEILDGDYGNLYVILNNGRGYGYQSYDTNYITNAKVEVCEPTTIVCDFKADGTGTTTVNDLLSNDWTACNAENARSAGSNGTLRLSIVSTDHSAGIHLGSLVNGGYTDGTGTYQNLIKKASLRINNIHQDGTSDCSTYPSYTPAGVFATFSKRIVDTNRYDRDHVANGCRAGFVFPRSDNSSSWSSYIVHPADPNIQYVALPSHPDTGYNKTSTSYIDQGISCLDSVVTLEVRGSDPSDFHYRLVIEKTGNEYDLGLCSTLGFAAIHVESSDRWRVGSYKEIDLAYIEYFDNYYIDNLGNITTTKPR